MVYRSSQFHRNMSVVAGALAVVFFSIFWALNLQNVWATCYASALALSVLFLWTHRHNLISLSAIFVGLSMIALTLPAVPYLLFGIEATPSLHASIFLNSLGQIYFLVFAEIFAPTRSLHCRKSQLFSGSHWSNFVRVNGLICLITTPFVVLTITAAGAWGYLIGDRSGDFDRIASMKGLGPLMIFSVINVTALFFWACGTWLKGRRLVAFIVVILMLFLNGFTGGRQNLIAFFFCALLIQVAIGGFNKKTFFVIPFIGLIIVFMKILRVSDSDGQLDTPWIIDFFLHFAGDFDSLNNDSALIDYVNKNGFFGFYHIWSNILIYIPREIFPAKPHFTGTLFLNMHLFPGVYLGAEGGTSLVLGFQGVWYAVYGLATMMFGNILLATSFGWADRVVYKKLHESSPGFFIVAYTFLIGQSIITYRDGFYSFLNTIVYTFIFFIFYKLINSLIKIYAITRASRPLA